VIEERTKIRGVTRDDPHTGMNRQEIIRQYVQSGTRLIPRLEPDNPVNPRAVALWLETESKQFHLGYLSDAHAENVGEVLRAGRPVEVTVSEVTGGMKGKPTRGVNIVIREVMVEQPKKKRFRLSKANRKLLIVVGLILFVICCLVPLCLGTGDVLLREIGILPTFTPIP